MKKHSFSFSIKLLRDVVPGLAGLALAGCAGIGLGGSTLDQLAQTTPTGSPFAQALFHDYAFLARSFGDLPDVESQSWFDPFSSANPLQPLQDTYATKAMLAGHGEEVAPEPAPTQAVASMRARLVADIAQAKDRFADDAARAQAQYDCWVLNGLTDGQAAAAAQCRQGLTNALNKLEQELHPPGAQTAPPSPMAAASAASPYTVYFDFDSWTLTAEALGVITAAVENARAGGQSRIEIVGHTDTAGAAKYNQDLSVRRAGVVQEAMVQMGARPEAIDVSGVGETNLAVETGDNAREPKNRRAVVTLHL